MSSLLGEVDESPDTDIRGATFDELRRMERRGELYPTRPDAEEIELDDSFWAQAGVVPPPFARKTSVHLRLDKHVLDWFKARGQGHLTRMNAVLKAYVYAQMNKALRAAVARDPAPKAAKRGPGKKRPVKFPASSVAARARKRQVGMVAADRDRR
jgi:uncharacterized protein (DUF4415 family)